ncbi:MAG: response regulator [Ectothiorhodospiraceae bacterium]|nr:response regulator [Ectothiorhodospiraceae bacterium]
MRILLAEDDNKLGKGIRTGLSYEGHAVDWVKDGQTALSALHDEKYDVLVLDVGLPRLTGLDVLDQLRQDGFSLPVLILTARDSIDDRISALDRGADDYVIKPCSLDELSARIRALARRVVGRTITVINFNDIELDPASLTVRKAGKIINMPTRCFIILQKLLENTGRVQSRTRLEESLYSWKNEIESNVLEVHIHNIRKLFGRDFIRTIRGVGYIVDGYQ